MSRQFRTTTIVLSFIVIILTQACASTTTPADPTRQPAAATTAPVSAAPEGPGDIARGKVVYDNYCLGCHPTSSQGNAPDIRGRSEDVVKRKVRSGGGMPAFPESMISNQQLNDVAAYVNSLKKQ